MARVIDEGMKAQLSKKQGFFLKYFPARIRNVGEDAKEASDVNQVLALTGVPIVSPIKKKYFHLVSI